MKRNIIKKKRVKIKIKENVYWKFIFIVFQIKRSQQIIKNKSSVFVQKISHSLMKFLVILLWYKTHTAISRMLVNRSWMSKFNKYTHMAIVKNFKEKMLRKTSCKVRSNEVCNILTLSFYNITWFSTHLTYISTRRRKNTEKKIINYHCGSMRVRLLS